MNWLDFVVQIGDGPFKVSVLFAIVYGLRELTRMRISLVQLATAIAVVVERVSSHEKRIRNLERKK